LILVFLIACGGNAQNTPPAVPVSPVPAQKHDDRPRVEVEYVVVHKKWVERAMTPPASDVTAWYETPDGRAAVPDVVEKKSYPTKKAASDAAKKSDPDVSVVENDDHTFAVVKKVRPSDDAIERAYKKAKSEGAMKKLADAILARWKKGETDARKAMADTVGEILGESAVADPDRPSPVLVDEPRFRTARVPASAKTAIEKMLKEGKAGDIVSAPIVEADAAIIARAVAPQH